MPAVSAPDLRTLVGVQTPHDTELPEVTRLQAIVLALCLAPASALAQKQQDPGLGLDLSGDKKPQEEAETPAAEPPAEEPPPLPSTAAETAPAQPLTPAERDVTLDDRVKSVQRKVYLKKNRFELAPFITLSVNDPYYTKIGTAVRGAYYLADTLAVAARVSLMQVLPEDDVRIAQRTFQSRIFYSVPQWSAMGDVEWSPLYGKVAFLNSILHFDAYLLGGMGVVNTEVSKLDGRGPSLAADLGVGLRFVAQDFLAVNVALVNTAYVDQPLGTEQGRHPEPHDHQRGHLRLLPAPVHRPGGRMKPLLRLLLALVLAPLPGWPRARRPPAAPLRQPAPTPRRPPSPPLRLPPRPRPRPGPPPSRMPVTCRKWTRTGSGRCASACVPSRATSSSRRAASRSAPPSRSRSRTPSSPSTSSAARSPTTSRRRWPRACARATRCPRWPPRRRSAPSAPRAAEHHARLPPAHLRRSWMGSPPDRSPSLGGLDVQWSPIYGKLSLLAEQVLHFDLYGIAGGTAVQYRGPGATQLTGGANLGVGMHFFINRCITVRAEFRDLIYVEKAINPTTTLRNQLLFELGVSFFFPSATPES